MMRTGKLRPSSLRRTGKLCRAGRAWLVCIILVQGAWAALGTDKNKNSVSPSATAPLIAIPCSDSPRQRPALKGDAIEERASTLIATIAKRASFGQQVAHEKMQLLSLLMRAEGNFFEAKDAIRQREKEVKSSASKAILLELKNMIAQLEA